jgi:roadblock/LC7 domain-containing protein
MSIVSELASRPGVLAAGEFSYRGDRYTYKGRLQGERARWASIMCRAANLSVHMEADILAPFCDQCRFTPARGWVVRGPHYTVCVVANVFCFLDSRTGVLNDTLRLMQERLAGAREDLV